MENAMRRRLDWAKSLQLVPRVLCISFADNNFKLQPSVFFLLNSKFNQLIGGFAYISKNIFFHLVGYKKGTFHYFCLGRFPIL